MARLWMYIIYFPVHFVGVTNMSPHYNLSPCVWRYITDIDVAAPAKKTTDLLLLKLQVVGNVCLPVFLPS